MYISSPQKIKALYLTMEKVKLLALGLTGHFLAERTQEPGSLSREHETMTPAPLSLRVTALSVPSTFCLQIHVLLLPWLFLRLSSTQKPKQWLERI